MHGFASFPKKFLRASARLVGAQCYTTQGNNNTKVAQLVLILKSSNLDKDHLSAEVLKNPSVDAVRGQSVDLFSGVRKAQ